MQIPNIINIFRIKTAKDLLEFDPGKIFAKATTGNQGPVSVDDVTRARF
jgi:hypothetical protein